MDALYRHAPVCGSYCDGPRMEYRADGDWVRVEDFDAAEKQRDDALAEVERLKGKLMEEARWVYDTGQRAKDALAEVERLREAVRELITP